MGAIVWYLVLRGMASCGVHETGWVVRKCGLGLDLDPDSKERCRKSWGKEVVPHTSAVFWPLRRPLQANPPLEPAGSAKTTPRGGPLG